MSIIYLTLFIIVNVYIHFSNGDDFSEYSAHLSQNDEYSLNWSVDSHQIWLNFSVCLNTNELNYRSNKNNYETDGRNQVKFFGLGFGRHDEPMNVDFYMLYFPILSKALKSDYEYLFMPVIGILTKTFARMHTDHILEVSKPYQLTLLLEKLLNQSINRPVTGYTYCIIHMLSDSR
ncbi:unnamed protein product [Heterobilharzia americana]|nr:unnamed protein product [Heterobilharzia americana]